MSPGLANGHKKDSPGSQNDKDLSYLAAEGLLELEEEARKNTWQIYAETKKMGFYTAVRKHLAKIYRDYNIWSASRTWQSDAGMELSCI